MAKAIYTVFRCWQEDAASAADIVALADELDGMHDDDIAKLHLEDSVAHLPPKDPQRQAHALVAKRARKRLYNRMTRGFERLLSNLIYSFMRLDVACCLQSLYLLPQEMIARLKSCRRPRKRRGVAW